MMKCIFKYLILLSMLIFSIGIVQAVDFDISECEISNCTETKLDTGEWIYNCTYFECTKYPHKLTDEIPNITVMNCTADDFIDYLENYTKVLESSLNLSEQLLDTKMTRDGYKMQWDDCEDDMKDINGTIKEKQDYIDNKCMDKDLCSSQISIWRTNATSCATDCEEKLGIESFYGLLKLGAGLVIATVIIYFAKLRRPTLEKSDVMPATGETSFDPRAVVIDTKIADVDARRKEDTDKILKEIAKIRETKGELEVVKKIETKKEEIKEPGTVEVTPKEDD